MLAGALPVLLLRLTATTSQLSVSVGEGAPESTSLRPVGVATPQCTNHSDCTDDLQAALASGASLVDVHPLPEGRPWIVRPLHVLNSHTTVVSSPH